MKTNKKNIIKGKDDKSGNIVRRISLILYFCPTIIYVFLFYLDSYTRDHFAFAIVPELFFKMLIPFIFILPFIGFITSIYGAIKYRNNRKCISLFWFLLVFTILLAIAFLLVFDFFSHIVSLFT